MEGPKIRDQNVKNDSIFNIKHRMSSSQKMKHRMNNKGK